MTPILPSIIEAAIILIAMLAATLWFEWLQGDRVQ